ncbi:hypothetical protein [Urechidicola sp. KH5]
MICDKNQYGEAKVADKLKLTLHTIFCGDCRCYTKQNLVMSKIYEKISHNQKTSLKGLSDHDKLALEQALREKMS